MTTAAPKTKEQANIELVRDFIETFWNQQKLDCIETVLTADYVDHAYTPQTAEGLEQMAIVLNTAFPDQHSTISEIIAQGDKVMVRMVMRGTHLGAFRGTAPTGNRIEATIYREYVIRDGQIAEHWALFDTATLLRQIGAQLSFDNACKIRKASDRSLFGEDTFVF
ncbi:ester cyclase [Paenibacillus sp. FSL H8-0034]|uniref:ester cyclase n=1 Tax=Paenibacillus sp. FSL H8-0034 TaxID=2954671 RepID=UPI0030F68428